MALDGWLNNRNLYSSKYIGTAGTKTYIGQTAYQVFSLARKCVQVYNGGTGTLVAGVIEVSNDNSHWGTLADIAGGTLGAASSYFYNGTSAWGYMRISAAYAADMVGTVSFFAVF
jgi:hypothetical protein